MTPTFNLVATVILSLYGAGVIFLIVASARAASVPRTIPETLPPVSVVVPFRNEAHNLAALISSLHAQTYPGTYEIILVNDGSTDCFVDAVEKAGSGRDMRVIDLASDPKGKGDPRSQAVRLGAESAAHEWIAIADADMVVHETWLATLMIAAADGADAVTGHTSIASKKNSLFFRFQALQHEFFSALQYAWSSAGLPMKITRGNAVFRKTFLAGGAAGLRSAAVHCPKPHTVSAVMLPEPRVFSFVNNSLRRGRAQFSPAGGLLPAGLMMLAQNILFAAAIAGALPHRTAMISFVNVALTYVFCAVTFRKMRSVQDPIGFLPFYPVLILESVWFVLAFLLMPKVSWKGRIR